GSTWTFQALSLLPGYACHITTETGAGLTAAPETGITTETDTGAPAPAPVFHEISPADITARF
ncbi:MAG TPA: hypothetical protein VKQ52_10040, partial [Puia sp.]|nr:hypothetical protein [Puia sp.]